MSANLSDMLFNWLPLMALIGVFAYFTLKSQSIYSGRSGKTHGEMLEDYLAELKRQNDLLEKAIQDQEARLQRLEQSRRTSGGGGGAAGR